MVGHPSYSSMQSNKSQDTYKYERDESVREEHQAPDRHKDGQACRLI